MKKEIAIVYMVAGLSSRFGGKIKQFAKIGPNNESLIEYSLNQAIKAGFEKIVFIVGNLTEKPFKDKFGDAYKNIPVLYAFQGFDAKDRDRPWGTADALCTLKNIIDCKFVICNGDDIYGENTFKILIDHLKESSEEATIGYDLISVIPEKGKTHRGIFKINSKGYVESLVETFNIEKSGIEESNLKPDDKCSMNIFAFQPRIIDLIIEKLNKFKQEHAGDRKIEFLLPTEISNLIQEKKIKMKIYNTPDRWYGVTNPEDEEIVRELIKGDY